MRLVLLLTLAAFACTTAGDQTHGGSLPQDPSDLPLLEGTRLSPSARSESFSETERGILEFAEGAAGMSAVAMRIDRDQAVELAEKWLKKHFAHSSDDVDLQLAYVDEHKTFGDDQPSGREWRIEFRQSFRGVRVNTSASLLIRDAVVITADVALASLRPRPSSAEKIVNRIDAVTAFAAVFADGDVKDVIDGKRPLHLVFARESSEDDAFDAVLVFKPNWSISEDDRVLVDAQTGQLWSTY